MVGIIERVLDYLRDRISKFMGGSPHFNPMNDDHVEQFLVRSCGADLQGRGISDDTLWQFATSNPASAVHRPLSEDYPECGVSQDCRRIALWICPCDFLAMLDEYGQARGTQPAAPGHPPKHPQGVPVAR